MSSVLDEMKKEAAERRSIEIAKNLLQNGKMSLEEIAEVLMLPLEKVKVLAKQNSSATAPQQVSSQA